MLSHESKQHQFRKSLLATSAALAFLACASQVAWAQDVPKTSTPTTTPSGSSDGASQPPNAVGEVVVTGTNIKGVKPIAPVITITRQDIDESGYSTIGDVIRSLPEDFSGGQNPGHVATNAAGVANSNLSNESTVDLFGLGSDATLTLINGHRMPADGFASTSADISVIPLGAIQRVEVVTDGSSSIYGSDAVAGVVNFILRKDYNGLEASAYYGGATEGGDETQVYSVLGGVVRDNWHALLSAEYQHEDPITASQRDFTSSAYGPTDLLNAQTSRSVIVSGGVSFSDKISLSIDGLYSDRETGNFFGAIGSYTEAQEVVTPNYNVVATLEFELPGDWTLKLSGTEAASSNSDKTQEIFSGVLYPTYSRYHNDVRSIEVAANGTALALSTGHLRTAFGGGYREEGFKNDYPGQPAEDLYVIRASRSVIYAYGEALLPLVTASENRFGLQELELSASGRYEHYSDFGETANPKVGIRYVPIDGLSLRGSWGTSFKAPTFLEMYQQTAVGAYPAFYYNYTGNALSVSGGNPNLKPERSTNWTIGADYTPPNIRSMKVSLTYFDISYTNRIVAPLTSADDSAVLTDPAYAEFVTVNPSLALVQSTIAETAEFRNLVGPGFTPSTVDLIVNDQYQNAVAQTVNGLDFSYRQRSELSIGDINTFANATWSHLTQQLSNSAPIQTLSGTIFNIPKFRARAGLSWSKYGMTATTIVNYTASETDIFVKPNNKIAPWWTFDENLTYRFPDSVGFRHGMAVTVSAVNLFDRAPPFAKSPGATAGAYYGIHYDSLNASAIGRLIGVKLTKKF